ncbi:MAG: mechanosensitive ion channel family protein [Acidimicrobiia bacterium]
MTKAADPNDEIASSAQSLWQTLLDALPRVGVAVLIVIAGWGIGRGVRWLMRARFRRSRTPSFANVISKLTSWVVVFVAALLAAAVTFPSVKPVNLLAGLGFFSVAIGFAFQDILENTLSGVLLLFRQPFRSGDQIDVVGRSGTVDEINIRETRLTTFDGESLIIPNRDVYKNVILVHTNSPTHRMHFDVGVAYRHDLEEVTAAIAAALNTVPGVSADPAPEALVRELGVSSVVVRALLWTDSRRYESITVLDSAIKAVKARLDHDAVELPADIVMLQGTPSLAAALDGVRQGAGQVGVLRPRAVPAATD